MLAQTFAKRLAATTAVAFGLLFGSASPATAQTLTAVEYYYAAWNFYFFTAFPDEIAGLDAGAYGGVWKRTGQTFSVWRDASSGALPTCRFFTVTFAPKSSHFYTPNAAECAGLMSNPNWEFESIAFYLQLPDVNGNCPPGTVILYRLYDNGMGGAPNHRFTTSLAIFNQMIAAGWIFEGDLRTYAFACVPAPVTAEGQWDGTTDTNDLLLVYVLDDGTFYALYSTPSGAASPNAGFVQGVLMYSGGQFASPNAVDVNFAGLGVKNASLSGSFVQRTSLNGTVSEVPQNATFAASYDSFYDQPASLLQAAGTFNGVAGISAGGLAATLTLSAAGVVSGFSNGCSYNGTLSPHGSGEIFDLSIAIQGDMCAFGNITMTGIAVYYPASTAVIMLATNAARTDGFLFVAPAKQ